MPASPEGIGRLHAWLDAVLCAWGHDVAAAWPIYVALDEVITNIAHHGYRTRPGEVDVVLHVGRNKVSATIADNAPPFDPRQIQPRSAPGGHTGNAGGHGVALVLRLMDHVGYEYHDGRNVITLVATLGPRAGEAP